MHSKSPARLARGAFLWATVLVAGLVSGCATAPPKSTATSSDCNAFYQQFERAISAAGAADAGSWRIAGEPRLRTNRLLAQLASQLQQQPLSANGWQRWLLLARELANERQQLEWQRLSLLTRHAISGGVTLATWQQRCEGEPTVEPLALAMPINDEYSTLQRTFGLYPLTQLGPKLGLKNLRRGFVDDFAQPLERLKNVHPLRHYRGYEQAQSKSLKPLEPDALGLPQPGPQLNVLLNQHAPLWEIETASHDDQPAALQWNATKQAAATNTQQPSEYRFTSYSWLNGAWRLQLNYQLWFPARSANHVADILAGRVDGLIWRVTLGANGKALAYDSIHPCGCYHLTIPTQGFIARQSAQQLPEPPIVLPAVAANQRWKLRVSAGEHQLRGMAAVNAADESSAALLNVRAYNNLLELPAANNQTRSAFRADGLINQTDRPERFLLWPMGIRSAGAMRQAGRQPIAFVGKRHFDDWNLLDTILQPVSH